MAYYNDQLRKLQQQTAEKKRLNAMLAELKEQKEQLEKRLRELDLQRLAEQEDVAHLEGRSLASFFYTLVGKRKEKLSQEREEAYAAEMKYVAVNRSLAAVKEDIRGKKEQLRKLYGCEERYEKMLFEKTESLRRSGTPEAEKLLELEDRLARLDSQQKEIGEAAAAGRRAKSAAQDILTHLDSAESWSTWDVLGGGALTDFAKHSHLDDAQKDVERLQLQLQKFKTELADITIQSDLQVSIDGFLRFADYFFDGLFADWAVLDRIRDSQNRVSHTKEQIDQVLRQLDSMARSVEQWKRQLKTELEQLILQAEG